MTTDRTHLQKRAEGVEIVPFTTDHLEGAWRLSQAESWPHRVEDWALTLSVSQGVVALYDGEIVGTSLCSLFGDVATLNMIVVDGRMRGRGLGRLMMEKIIAIAGDREQRLVATQDGIPLYEKMGFVGQGRIVQHQGIVGPVPALDETVREADADTMAADLEAICQMDMAASGMSRAKLLAGIALAGGTVLIADGGFAMLRRFGRGQVVGPIVANSTETAKTLISAAAVRCEGAFLRLDVPAEYELSGFIEKLGLAHAGGGLSMTRAAKRRDPQDVKTYALVSQALG
ncbi:hypothetical protein TH25_03245 [Thalassospira profundimaris]|uniref:N-acetyltransferase domain-containing protein n=1 Tax=Thalassospira profundimaris TaxID=502049 RepID=A0A367XLD7_9PROT|nr:GNAT family N-acetyltransferase [Thalassospira profundimaris]RCK53552.1 hypothetical protein TH25_03245 [Thalassospira profundimaris]